MTDQWMRLLADDLDEVETESVLLSSAEELEAILSRRQDVASGVVAIITASVSAAWSENTWGAMNQSLMAYLDSESAYLFTWAAGDLSGARVERLEKHGVDKAAVLLRRVIGEFGSRINAIVQFSNGWSDDWQSIVCRTLLEETENVYRVRCDVTKFNQEQLRLEGPPDPIMQLTTYLLDTLRGVAAHQFHPEIVQRFFESVDDVSEALRERESQSDTPVT